MMQPIDLNRAIILDTETTGLSDVSEVCEISIIEADTDQILMNTLVRPSLPIPIEASRVHGITDEDVASARTWKQIHRWIISIMKNRHVIIYNGQFDLRLMGQSAAVYGLELPFGMWRVTCAMCWYAQFWGDWNDYHESYRWQSLEAACLQQGIRVNGRLHRALTDVRATLALVRHVNSALARTGNVVVRGKWYGHPETQGNS